MKQNKKMKQEENKKNSDEFVLRLAAILCVTLLLFAIICGVFQTCNCSVVVRMNMTAPETNMSVDTNLNINGTLPCLAYYTFSELGKNIR
jgi:peptidoglycan biosynthesis protein MviN/MurJ (putative lipid II flippase)